MRVVYDNFITDKKKKRRATIPKTVKDRLWDTTFGSHAGDGACYVCGALINSKRFEAGHVVSVFHGGATTLDNLRCICSSCNKSMGVQHLEKFKSIYFPNMGQKHHNANANANANDSNANEIFDVDLEDDEEVRGVTWLKKFSYHSSENTDLPPL